MAITGASGVTYAVRLLQILKEIGVETHGIMTPMAVVNLRIETSMTKEAVAALCSKAYDEEDLAADIASGSFVTRGMVIVPCSTRTLAGVAHGFSDNLVLRAADVCLKEGRKLVLVPRETPLNVAHMRNMILASESGATILPAMPGFYHRPKNIQDLIDHVVGKILDSFGIENEMFRRWSSDQSVGGVKDSQAIGHRKSP